VIHIASEDLFTFSCVHEPSIGVAKPVLEGPTPF
jgi:hypothetical protein